MDNGKKQIKELKQNDGDKFGAHPERDKTGATRFIPLRDKEIGVPFMWCYKVWRLRVELDCPVMSLKGARYEIVKGGELNLLSKYYIHACETASTCTATTR